MPLRPFAVGRLGEAISQRSRDGLDHTAFAALWPMIINVVAPPTPQPFRIGEVAQRREPAPFAPFLR
jgi:hypothetical protein